MTTTELEIPGAEARTAPDGRALRSRVPRSQHGAWQPAADRDPIALINAANRGRNPALVPIRLHRMARSPFAFYRGAAAVMAGDLAATPSSGLHVQLCGDAHLLNFGMFASPERELVFDINDFDETARGPFEWDLKRLAASVALAGREIGLSGRGTADATRASVASYRRRIREYAERSPLDVWYAHVEADDVGIGADRDARRAWSRELDEARRNTAERLLPRITQVVDGAPRFVDDPPLLYHVPGSDAEGLVRAVLERYRMALRPEVRMLFDRYSYVDVAIKVVGVGSVGTWCGLVLFVTPRGESLLLQVKEAVTSALEPYLGPDGSAHPSERVVTGQRAMQASTDVFLAPTQADDGRSFYVRQFRDMRGGIDLARTTAEEFLQYAVACGWALARAHARTGEASAIGGYLGKGDAFDEGLVKFATAYADQTETDYTAFADALRAGVFGTTDGTSRN